MAIYKLFGLAVMAMVTAIVVVVTVASTAAPRTVGANWRGTILCTTKIGSVARSFGVDDHGRLATLTIRPVVPPGQKVELAATSALQPGRAATAETAADARLLGRATEPLIVRTSLTEDGQTHYRFNRDGQPWGCRVAFDRAAAVSVAKLIVSRHSALLRLGLRDGELVHLGPLEAPRNDPVQAAKAKPDLEHFLTLIARGSSIAACAVMARDAMLNHDACIMLLESAKFVYRDRYVHASVERIAFFDLNHDSYALATINRGHSTVRAIMIHERGRYRYLGDFQYSPFELW